MWHNWPLETCHAIMSVLSGKEIHCLSNLIARYSSWIVYSNDFWSVGWTRGILWIQNRWNCSGFSIRGTCKIAYKISDIMKDCSLINLYMYQIFSSCRANLGHDTNLVYNLVSKAVRWRWLNRAGVSFSKHKAKLWFIIERMLILREFNPLQRVARWLLNWNMMVKIFYPKLKLSVL